MSSIKEDYLKYIGPKDSLYGYTRSYKMIFLIQFFKYKDDEGKARVVDVVNGFISFYKDRAAKGLITDKDAAPAIANIKSCTFGDAFILILRNPYRAIREKGFISTQNIDGTDYFILPADLNASLSDNDIQSICKTLQKKLSLYYLSINDRSGDSEKTVATNISKKLDRPVGKKEETKKKGTVGFETVQNFIKWLFDHRIKDDPPFPEEEYIARIEKLYKKVDKEFRKRRYISDIRISDDEYAVLRYYLHYAIIYNDEFEGVCDNVLFATAVVFVAVKTYSKSAFWPDFFDELNIKNSTNLQGKIGAYFYNILRKFDKIRFKDKGPRRNILAHCFMSDHFAMKYFDFLYKFYELDMDRDIRRLDKDLMNDLMDSIFSDDGTRAYMLSDFIVTAMKANPQGAKIRVRNHLKKLDKFFWNYDYKITTDHRIYNLMQEWVSNNKEFETIYKERGLYGTKSSKMYSAPYLFFDESIDFLTLQLPAQSIRQENAEDVYWEISSPINHRIEAEKIESVVGYKVQADSLTIPWDIALEQFRISLINGHGDVIKSFGIKKEDARFFDRNGYPINEMHLKVGSVTGVSKEPIKSSSEPYVVPKGDILVSYFEFEYEDIIRLPNGNAVIVGKDTIEDALVGNGLVENAICKEVDNTPIYRKVPFVALRMSTDRSTGTVVELDGKRFGLNDLKPVEFNINDRSGEQGYYIDLSEHINENGLHTVLVDIPGGRYREWPFLYIEDLDVQFEDAPYVFVPKGNATIYTTAPLKWVSEGCVFRKDLDSYEFDIEKVGRYFELGLSINDTDYTISYPVPAVFILMNGIWTSQRPSAIWHTDLPDLVEISVPYHKLTLSIDEDDDDSDRSDRALEYKRNAGSNSIVCDITPLKSYLNNADNKYIKLQFGKEETELFSVIIHGRVIYAQLISDHDEGKIRINASIIGKSDYYADIRENGITIAEKVPLIEGTADIEHVAENATYDLEIFESEPDDSGFGDDDFYSLGVFSQELVNPYDMNARSLRVLDIEQIASKTRYSLAFEYYIENLKRTKSMHEYTGMMVVERTKLFQQAAFPVKVFFYDLKNPDRVWIQFYEFEEYYDFLYDTKKRAFLQEESQQLSKKASYIRYTYLSDDEYVFHVDLCKRELTNYNSLPSALILPERGENIRFKDSSKDKNAIENMGLSRKAYNCLKRAGINYVSDIEQLDKRRLFKIRNLGKTSILEIVEKMRSLGYKSWVEAFFRE